MQLQDLSPWVDARHAEMEAALKELVAINTHTPNTDGVDAGMDLLTRMAEDMGFTVETVNARHRLIKSGSGVPPRVMLITHMDTVHPVDSDFKEYTPLGDGFVQGPGVGDIKGGTVIGLWTMKAISEICRDYDLQMVVSADEERGSPTIRKWYWNRDEHGADYAIGLEPGFPQGDLSPTVDLGVVYQRRGYAAISFTIKGKSAHSGEAHFGLSAVEAAAHKILALQALNDPSRNIAVNVGMINGGTAANTVPGEVTGVVSFRFERKADGEEIKSVVERILSEPVIYNEPMELRDSAEFQTDTFIPPMESTPQSQKLVDIVLEEAKALAHPVVAIARGGGSDANHVSGSGVPSICGMGAPAQGIHTQEEKIYLPMLFERVKLLTRTVYRIINERP